MIHETICGQNLTGESETTLFMEVRKDMKCSNCGAELKTGALFCGKCGTKVQAAAPVTPPVTPPIRKVSGQVDWNNITKNGDIGLSLTPQNMQADPEFVTEPHLACCLLVDVSGSMSAKGKIDQLNQALAMFRDQVCSDSLSAKRVEVCVISFGTNVKVEVPFVPVSRFEAPVLRAGGLTAMGEGISYALEEVHQRCHMYHQMGIECFKPFIMMITDGVPTDDVSGVKALIDARENQGSYGHLRFHAFAVEGADTNMLYSLTERVMAVMNNNFASAFNWASKTMQTISHSHVDDKTAYPPTEEDMVIPVKGQPVKWSS